MTEEYPPFFAAYEALQPLTSSQQIVVQHLHRQYEWMTIQLAYTRAAGHLGSPDVLRKVEALIERGVLLGLGEGLPVSRRMVAIAPKARRYAALMPTQTMTAGAQRLLLSATEADVWATPGYLLNNAEMSTFSKQTKGDLRALTDMQLLSIRPNPHRINSDQYRATPTGRAVALALAPLIDPYAERL